MTTYTAAQGRKFGLTLAGAFAVLAALTWWRGRDMAPVILGALGFLLLAGGLAAPARLEPVERAWMKLAHLLSRVTTPIFMAIVYFVVLTPTGWVRRTAGKNPLVHAVENESYWKTRAPSDQEKVARRMERQF